MITICYDAASYSWFTDWWTTQAMTWWAYHIRVIATSTNLFVDLTNETMTSLVESILQNIVCSRDYVTYLRNAPLVVRNICARMHEFLQLGQQINAHAVCVFSPSLLSKHLSHSISHQFDFFLPNLVYRVVRYFTRLYFRPISFNNNDEGEKADRHRDVRVFLVLRHRCKQTAFLHEYVTNSNFACLI